MRIGCIYLVEFPAKREIGGLRILNSNETNQGRRFCTLLRSPSDDEHLPVVISTTGKPPDPSDVIEEIESAPDSLRFGSLDDAKYYDEGS